MMAGWSTKCFVMRVVCSEFFYYISKLLLERMLELGASAKDKTQHPLYLYFISVIGVFSPENISQQTDFSSAPQQIEVIMQQRPCCDIIAQI